MYRLKMENNEILLPVARRWLPKTIVYKGMNRNNHEETADRMLVKKPKRGKSPLTAVVCQEYSDNKG